MSMGSGGGDGGGGVGGGVGGECPLTQQTPMRLRFAPQRQLGRSYVSSTRPMGVPTFIKDKFYRRGIEEPELTDKVKMAEDRVFRMFNRNPRDKYDKPVTSAQEYGWWCTLYDKQAGMHMKYAQLQYHICDSEWMKEQLRVLAADSCYKRL